MSAVSLARGEVELQHPDAHEPMVVSAGRANHWTEGMYDVWWLAGNCNLAQGALRGHGDEAMLWIERGDPANIAPRTVIVYLEGHVTIDNGLANGAGPASAAAPGQPVNHLADDHWLGRLYVMGSVRINAPVVGLEPGGKPAIYNHAMADWNPSPHGEIQRTQYSEFGAPPPAAPIGPVGMRRIRAFPRTDVPVQIQWFPSPSGKEWVAVVTSGVNLIIDGLKDFGSIDVTTDRLVLWTTAAQEPNLAGHAQTENTPLEIYMEGNVVFRQGNRVVQAPAMYYDVTQHTGLAFNAELLTPLPTQASAAKFPGLVRMRASVLQQLDDEHFAARDASITTSRMGDPTFDLRARQAQLQDSQHPVVNWLTGAPETNPRTGEPQIEHEEHVIGYSNTLYAENVPVFYWPYFATDLEQGDFLVRNIEIKEDSVFGVQLLTEFNAYQLLGIRNPPKGTEWYTSFDYLSDRGFGAGTEFRYDRDHLLDVPGHTTGMFDAWFIDDHGQDDLGSDRRDVEPDQKFRGRILADHREQLPDDWQISGELGYITDRNFLEEYFQHEFDSHKDETTDLELRRNYDNMSLTIFGSVRLDDFNTQTEWYPRLDHNWLGQPLLGDNVTWYEHTNVGYARQNNASAPSETTDPQDFSKFTLLPWEMPGPGEHGERLATRQELDYPMQWGPVKVVPFALGEVAHWGEDLQQDDLNRAYGVVGVRASIPFWAVDPTVQNSLFNVNGIAHKIVLSADFSASHATDGNEDLTRLPLYDELDDDSVEFFRRRQAFNTFGIPPGPGFPLGTTIPEFPAKFDPRFYALRTGMDEWVTGPTEIAGDQTVLRLDADQRWQTERGPPGDQHIIDWITLDTEASVYPNANQNFGSNAGLFDYDFHWYVGDRVTVVSSGAADFFSGGQREFTIGSFFNRPPRGTFYTGFYLLDGPIHQEAVNSSYTYRMSPKWAATFTSSFNISPSSNIGESLVLTRIGEAFLMSMGVNVNASRGTVGASFDLEPRSLGTPKLARGGNLDLPPAGAFGLE